MRPKLHRPVLGHITSMPPSRLDLQSELWATICYNELCAVDLRPVTQKAKRPQSTLMMAHASDKAPALRALEPSLVDHSGLASTLLSNNLKAGKRLLRAALDLDALTLPEPADNRGPIASGDRPTPAV